MAHNNPLLPVYVVIAFTLSNNIAGHLGIRKTIDWVVAELFLPGVCVDVQGSVSHVTYVKGPFKKVE